ncbi:flagellar basal body L-ring protein FlgH [Limnobacter sp.]|uniref:flagellar basal body L-ring protein FlgH n=1 Tax=Limnobacter sp. TaxID=2003368 RepID=UPI003517C331
MKRLVPIGLTAALSITLGACSTFVPRVDMPEQTTVQQTPQLPPQMANTVPTGSLYNPVTYRPLFEDQRARFVGDVLTIQILEQINAAQTNSMSASRSDSASIDVPLIQGFFGNRDLRALNAQASSEKDFSGQGETRAANNLTGTITVTVSGVLPNGNLQVVGEKQIGTNRDVEYLRFSGVVNPITIQPGNVVPSTKVADARLEYRGKGVLDSATTMGWLSRFFLTVLPF